LSERTGLSDKRLLWGMGSLMLALIVVTAVLRPAQIADDPRPTTTNTGPQGARASYLVLQRLGRTTSQWNQPLAEFNDGMDDAKAARTTLVLAAPDYDQTELPRLRTELERFLKRGGRVLATGPTGAELLPGAEVKVPGMVQPAVCQTVPEGAGALARAGSVEMAESAQWTSKAAKFEVEQRCGEEAVVVRFAVGDGEAIWWSSAGPMENDELTNDADLRLTLVSVGEGREVVFDESLHGAAKTMWDAAKGLPLWWMALQCGLFFVLMVFSLSRRRGPLRMPVTLPRSSPVEFATSMGDLYEKAGATSAATEAAKRRLLRVLSREAGLSQESIKGGPEAIAEALKARLGGDWSEVSGHLLRCREMEHGKASVHGAFALVRALNEDVVEVRARLKPPVVEGIAAGVS
jgi:hypothetical protein